MLSVEDARAQILAVFKPLPAEIVSVERALGRVLAQDVSARVTQPPRDISAMDGYAVRAGDVPHAPVTLRVVGEVPAGGDFGRPIRAGEAVRIFTGAPLPEGADTIVIQENAARDGDEVTVQQAEPAGRWVRPAGLDFEAGSVGLSAGRQLTARDVGLAAAMNRPWLPVRRRPRVAVLATGNEVVLPGEHLDRQFQRLRALGVRRGLRRRAAAPGRRARHPGRPAANARCRGAGRPAAHQRRGQCGRT